jgi:hypothetical protein
MEKYDSRRSLGSYSVDQELLRKLVSFIDTGIPRILHVDQRGGKFSVHTLLTLAGSKESIIYHPVSAYTDAQFHNDLQVLRIELLYVDESYSSPTRAIAMILRLGDSRDDSDLSIAVQATAAAEKVRAIEEGLLATLEPYKNANRVVYPNEFMPTMIFVLGFFIGIGALMFTQPILQILCIALFGLSIYFVARRFTMGYCSFASRRQGQLKNLLGLVTIGILLFVVTASVLMLR